MPQAAVPVTFAGRAPHRAKDHTCLTCCGLVQLIWLAHQQTVALIHPADTEQFLKKGKKLWLPEFYPNKSGRSFSNVVVKGYCFVFVHIVTV